MSLLHTRTFTLDQVKSHDSCDDLWIIIYNRVFDVTAFVASHPGGIEGLLDCGGVDGTESFEDVAHSDDALRMLCPYFVGIVDPSQWRQYPRLRKEPEKFLNNIVLAPEPQAEKPLLFDHHNQDHQLDLTRKKGSRKYDALYFGVLGSLVMISIVSILYLQKVKWSLHIT